MTRMMQGIVIGGAVVGAAWLGTHYVSSTKADESEFANKAKCATYTEKREKAEMEKARAFGNLVTVEGFYSPTENTCVTLVNVTYPGANHRRYLNDELTGQTIATTYESLDPEVVVDMTSEQYDEWFKQDKYFGEQLIHYRGTDL